MKRFLAVAVLIVTPQVVAQPATQPPRDSGMPETVSVTGTGRAKLVPDRFTFTVGVQTTAPTVEDAVNQNNQRIANVIAALKKAGAKDDEIRTTNFTIYPQQVYEQGKPPQVTGYTVSNSVAVTKKEIATAGKLLQVAVSAGVNESSSLNFEVSDPSRGRDQGLRAAYEDAKGKASLLAQAAGRTLGRALIITEGGATIPQPPRPMMRAMEMKAQSAVSDVPVESGSNELTYTISVLFALQ